jgi:hypothetical protein
MRLPFNVGGAPAGYLLAFAIAFLATPIRGRCDGGDAFPNPADPDIGALQMEEVARVPVPSVRTALASNPSISDELLSKLEEDDYDSVVKAAKAAWASRYPSGTGPRPRNRGGGSKSALPDYAELRDLIYRDRVDQAALAWRHLPPDLRSSLAGVVTWDKETDKLEPLLEFVVMAEPPGGPLATSMYFQLLSKDREKISEMETRGLLSGINSFGMYAQAIRDRDRKLIKQLADSGLAPNQRGAGGETPLMAAASTGDVQIIVELMCLGAEVDAKDDESLSASDYARNSLKVDAAEVLAIDPGQKALADKLKGRFTPAAPDSQWIGWWTAVDYGTKQLPFPTVMFGRDGTFDMPPGPAGSWYEVDPNNVVVTPMLKTGTKNSGSRTLYGEMNFQHLENPTRLQVKFHGDVLEFQPRPDASDPDSDATILAFSAAKNLAKTDVAAPSQLKAVATLEKVTLSWDAVPGVAGYFIYRDGTLLSSEFVTVPAYTDDAPPPAPSVTYEVQTVGDIHHLSLLSAHATVAPFLKDTDGKGLPDRWQMLHFGHLGTDPNADPDRNGLTYLEKYKKGLDPNDYYNGIEPLLVSPNKGRPGPDDDLTIIVHHPDGTPWRDAPATFTITSGRRRISVQKNTPPYVEKIVVRTDDTGFARCYLQPLTQP